MLINRCPGKVFGIVAEVNEYDYHEQVVSANPNHAKEMRCRIMGWAAFRKHAHIMHSRLPVSLKGRYTIGAYCQ